MSADVFVYERITKFADGRLVEALRERTCGSRPTMKSYISACGRDGRRMFMSSLDIKAATKRYCNKST